MRRSPANKECRTVLDMELDEFKKFLGPVAAEYNDAQLRQLRYEMHAMAELLLDFYEFKNRRKQHEVRRPRSFDGFDQ